VGPGGVVTSRSTLGLDGNRTSDSREPGECRRCRWGFAKDGTTDRSRTARARAHNEKTPNLGRSHWRQGTGFPVTEEALTAYAVIEFESPRLVANAQDITIDGHVVALGVE
jgi:hypothetical protein